MSCLHFKMKFVYKLYKTNLLVNNTLNLKINKKISYLSNFNKNFVFI